ncbi:MAG: DUF3526 domain-containing protein [Deltaproteobacteria bacterium]|nr:DUF3526 domain-containing protein [Deltaproteobacteria bacterium]
MRSKSAIAALLAVVLIIAATSVLTAVRFTEERQERAHQQEVAEETFLSQPARHPHRMVHYGHYVFRTPPPLAIIDPGVDSVTGQSIFLEGHRQNTAMFADTRASANVGGFQTLSPASVYKVLIPLLLIALGHGVFVREREARTLAPLLAQGVSGVTLYAGKVLALTALSAALLTPMLIMSLIGVASGEAASVSLAVVAAYGAYLLVWSALIVLMSAALRTRGVVLGCLVFVWLSWSLITPRLAVASASAAEPSPGKLETDYQLKADLRKLGDGHNAADPAFNALKANLLAEYDVDSVEELPINFRGAVAQASEADLTEVMNEYAERRMALEIRQSHHANGFGWLSPTLAVSAASRHLAGVDLETHHRFLREAEAVRFDFVQGLNKSHVEELSYADDIHRNQSAEASRRARISPENWSVLNEFRFQPATADERFGAAKAPISMLTVWLTTLIAVGVFASRRLKP